MPRKTVGLIVEPVVEDLRHAGHDAAVPMLPAMADRPRGLAQFSPDEPALHAVIGQGEQFFRALKHFNNAPAEIVFFPRENHNLTRTGEPKHVVESMEWQLWWFDRYVEGRKDAIPPDRR